MIRVRFGKFSIKREELKLLSFNLKKKIPMIKTKKEVDVGIFDHPINSELIKKSTIDERLSRGELLFLAKDNSGEIGYLFAAQERCWVSEIEDWLEIDGSEVYLYDAFTRDDRRGMHIYPFLISEAARYFKAKNHCRTLIFTTVSNRSSIKGIIRAGFIPYQTNHFLSLCGLRIWKFGPRKHDVKSRFATEI